MRHNKIEAEHIRWFELTPSPCSSIVAAIIKTMESIYTANVTRRVVNHYHPGSSLDRNLLHLDKGTLDQFEVALILRAEEINDK